MMVAARHLRRGQTFISPHRVPPCEDRPDSYAYPSGPGSRAEVMRVEPRSARPDRTFVMARPVGPLSLPNDMLLEVVE